MPSSITTGPSLSCTSPSGGNSPSPAPPVTPPAPAEQPIDLETALVLAGVDNPTIALAQEAVRASLAEQLQARALLFPSVNAGANYRLHRGNLLSSGGI